MRYVHGLVVLATVLMPTAVYASERTGSQSIASGDLRTAEATLNGERAIFPQRPELMLNLAAVYARTQRDGAARDLYRQVLARDEVRLNMADGSTLGSHEVARRGMARIGTVLTAR